MNNKKIAIVLQANKQSGKASVVDALSALLGGSSTIIHHGKTVGFVAEDYKTNPMGVRQMVKCCDILVCTSLKTGKNKLLNDLRSLDCGVIETSNYFYHIKDNPTGVGPNCDLNMLYAQALKHLVDELIKNW